MCYFTWVIRVLPWRHACMLSRFSHAWLSAPVRSLAGSSVHGILQARCWSRLPCPPPRDLPDPGIKPESLMSPALAGGFFSHTREGRDHLLNSSITPRSLEDPGSLSHPFTCFYDLSFINSFQQYPLAEILIPWFSIKPIAANVVDL